MKIYKFIYNSWGEIPKIRIEEFEARETKQSYMCKSSSCSREDRINKTEIDCLRKGCFQSEMYSFDDNTSAFKKLLIEQYQTSINSLKNNIIKEQSYCDWLEKD